jgi:hypothetical protein
MAAKLGNILYWLGCVVAVLLFAVGAFVWFNRTHPGDLVTTLILIGLGAIVWLVGRVCRYVLADT